MQNKYKNLPLLFLLSGLSRACPEPGKGQGNTGLFAGAASGSITPLVACYLAGYGGAGKSVGVHDSIYAKAVVVEGQGDAIAILTLDCIGLMHPELETIRKKVAQRLPGGEFDPMRIVVTSTHTHLGPDVVGLWGRNRFSSGVQKDYLEQLTDMAASKIAQAWHTRRPATARYAQTEHGEGWVFNISVPEEIDRSVTTLQFLDEAGHSIATLTNFACHPTIMGPESRLISADYVGGLYVHLDTVIGGVNLFLQGAIGGWVQPVGEATFENTFKTGAGLAQAALDALKTPLPLETPTIVFRSKKFEMPVSSFGFRLLSRLGVLKRKIGKTVKTEIAWFEIGDAQFVTHPGESSPLYGLESKKLMQKPGPKFVMGLAMDAMGYILRPEFFDKTQAIPHSPYLTSMSVGKHGGPKMMEVVRELASGIQSTPK